MNSIDAEPWPLESDLLRTFLAVARHGNVTRAGDELGRTQSAISVQIARLERRLAVRLFDRRPRGVALTEAGETLRDAAQRIVDDLDRTAAAFVADPLVGRLRIGIPDEYGSSVLPEVLAVFARRHRSVEVSVRCGFSTEFPSAVAADELDLAVFADCGTSAEPALFTEETCWVAAKGFRWEPDESLPLALFDRSCWWRDAALEALSRKGVDYRLAYSSESVAGVKAAIMAGLAVGVLAQSTLEPEMQVIGAAQGMPALPSSRLVLLESDSVGTQAKKAMAEAIREGFGKLMSPRFSPTSKSVPRQMSADARRQAASGSMARSSKRSSAA